MVGVFGESNTTGAASPSNATGAVHALGTVLASARAGDHARLASAARDLLDRAQSFAPVHAPM